MGLAPRTKAKPVRAPSHKRPSAVRMVSLGRWATHVPNDGLACAGVGEAEHKVARDVRDGRPIGKCRHVLVFVVRDNVDMNGESAGAQREACRWESHRGTGGLSAPGRSKHS